MQGAVVVHLQVVAQAVALGQLPGLSPRARGLACCELLVLTLLVAGSVLSVGSWPALSRWFSGGW